ncbi:transcription antitermination factor NusB [Fodinicurvata halophila]|uniref:Transcription antitermination protein NusB n=1 Tax=Fodinicurvata halophila TaxID=1419723 RepID=A0ABV8UNR3_9PROT
MDKVTGSETENGDTQKPQVHKSVRKRRAARLAAVQALYQIEMNKASTEAVILEFLKYRTDEEIEGYSLGEVDQKLFTELVRGVHREAADLDDMLSAVISEGWQVERLEFLLRLILRAGTYEIGHRLEFSAKAAINEYVDLAHDFFNDREPAMVNGMLDRIARSLRSEEFETG